MEIQTDKKLSERLNDLIQQAVDKAIERHRQRGESIAIGDEQGKVKIIPADKIHKYQKLNKINKNQDLR